MLLQIASIYEWQFGMYIVGIELSQTLLIVIVKGVEGIDEFEAIFWVKSGEESIEIISSIEIAKQCMIVGIKFLQLFDCCLVFLQGVV